VCFSRWNSLPIGVFCLVLAIGMPARVYAQGDGAASAPKAKEDAGIDLPGGPSLDEQRELEEMLRIVNDFQEQTKAYKKEIQLIVERKYDEKRQAVVDSFERAISEIEIEENRRRKEAIEIFERFLSRYPNDSRYTPDALWRLAELHYEKSKLELAEAEEKYEKALDAFNRGERKSDPLPPVAHFERAVSLLQRLISGFPGYGLADGAHYLLAYCLAEQGEEDESEQVWSQFVERFPSSRLLPEVYTRLGELYFDNPDKLEQAIEAYKRVLDFPDSPMFDKAMYKLAWTYYKIDRFDEAVEQFDRLIAWADTGEQGEEDMARSELRKEAMQYLAISFAEDEWPRSGTENAKQFIAGKGGRKYAGEFFRKLGEVFHLDTHYDRAVVALREAIRREPTHPDNPKLMMTIIDSHQRIRQMDEATAAQEELVDRFGEGSDWWKANGENNEVLSEARRLTENALHASAVFHHTMAQRHKQQERPEEARREYAQAAKAYEDYLKRFPRSRDVYRLTYYLAESYYYSLQFEKAAVAYATVRDNKAGTEFLSDSANSVVMAVANLIKQAEEAGALPPIKLMTSKDRPADAKVEPRELPPLRKRMIDALDAYVDRLPQSPERDTMAFRAARTLYAHDHFEKARERFASIVAETQKDELSSSSINLIIESYLITKDWAQVELWSRKLAGLTRDPQLKKSLKAFELGARFKRASNLMAAGQEASKAGKQDEANRSLDEAAAEFVRLVDDDPKGGNSDKALNNAAYCYTLSNRPVSAGRLYERIVREYSSSEFADKSLFLMAGSAEAAYDFQKAIDNYLALVDKYKDSKFRGDALYNAAVALEGDQQYRRAAEAFERYAKLFKDRPDSAENYFHAGVVLGKAKSHKSVIALFGRFIRTYGRDAAEQERLVQAHMKMAEARVAMGRERDARKGYGTVLKLFDRYQLPGGGRAAEAAAKARFELADHRLKVYEKITFEVSPRKLKKVLNKKAVELKKMEALYRKVFAYKRVDWTLAAYYRLGYLYENFADVLINSPCPKGLNQEECDMYKGKLEEFAEAPIKKAVSAYAETMEKSKSFKVANDWTRRTRESLNRFEPIKYPLQKQPEAALVLDCHGALPLLQAVVQTGVKPEGK